MTKQEIRALLSSLLPAETRGLVAPTAAEWRAAEARLGIRFPGDFVHFIDLMAEFEFPGEIYNLVQAGKTNGNDTIETVYSLELGLSWPTDLVPFYGIGNGDYFALSRVEGVDSAVYYRYHEDGRVERYCDSFSDWLLSLPAFLAGQ